MDEVSYLKRYNKLLILGSVATFTFLLSPVDSVHAAPQGGVVSAGSAEISSAGSKTDIHQSSQKAVIDWKSFNLNSSEHTEFHQPSSSSITLNRIHDTNPSSIDGHVTANGHIMLINPNGIIFGNNAIMDVGSITASTANISNDDFMAGNYHFNEAGRIDAKIINNGLITAKEAGLVNLVAPHVENNGIIQAKLGRVQLASADTFSLDLAGDGLINIGVSPDEAAKLVKNTGSITAEGGYITMTAAQARSALDALVENTGTLEASSMTKSGGRIFLGGSGSHVKNSGSIKANGKTGGGEILIGGDYQGSGDTPTSEYVEITETSVIQANATDIGDGGRVIIWADNSTLFQGKLEAKGGINGGNGGFAEVSGKRYLGFYGTVDLSGDILGTLLLDPDDIDIVAGTTIPGEYADEEIVFTENSDSTTTIGATTIANSLSSNANVILQANNTIDVDAAIISMGSGNLTLQTAAGGVITINQEIDVNAGNLSLIADEIDILADISGNGDLLVNTADAAVAIELAGTADNSEFDLETTELSHLQNGFNSVTIGSDAHTGGVIANGNISFSDDTNIRNLSNDIYFNGTVTTTDNANLSVGTIGTSSSEVEFFDDVNIAGDLEVISHGGILFRTAGKSLVINGDMAFNNVHFNTEISNLSNWSVFGNTDIDTHGNITITNNDAFTFAGDVNLDTLYHHVYIQNNNTTFATNGDLRLEATTTVHINDDIQADGNITISSTGIDIDSSSTIAGNSDGSSTLTFIEYGEDADMELGGTGHGAAWSMETNEISTIQSNFEAVTYGSTSLTGDIEITDDISIFGNTYFITANNINSSNNSKIQSTGSGDTTLTMQAGQHIIITDSDISSSSGEFNIILNSDHDANQEGAVSITSTNINTNNGYFVAGGGSGNIGGTNGILGDGDGSGADDTFAYGYSSDHPQGVHFRSSNIHIGSGSAFINGRGWDASTSNAPDSAATGVLFRASSLYGDGGIIDISGHGGGAASNSDYNVGIYLKDTSEITNDTGDITLYGHGGSGDGPINYGVTLSSSGTNKVETTSGTINVEGKDPKTDSAIYVASGASGGIKSNGSGTINLNGNQQSIITRSWTTIGGSNNTGDITLTSKSIETNSAHIITTGTVSFIPINSEPDFHLGSAGNADITLTNDDLENIQASKLIIGDATSNYTSDIVVEDTDLSNVTYDLELYGGDISLRGITMGSGDILAYAADDNNITISNAITRNATGTATLDLRADETISFHSNGDITATNGALNIILNADRDGNLSGAIVMDNAEIETNGGSLTIGGGTDPTTEKAYGNATNKHGLVMGNASSLSTGAGNIIINGNGYTGTYDVGLSLSGNSSINTTSGDIDIDVIGPQYGTLISGATISADTGNITIRSESNGNAPIRLMSNSVIETTGETGGDIEISSIRTGDIHSTFYFCNNVSCSAGTNATITTVNGDMTFNTTGLGNFNVAADNTVIIGDANTRGDITINASYVTVDDATITTQGNVSFLPATNNVGINLGSGTTSLSLNQTEMTNINAGTVIIGHQGSGTGSVDIDTLDLSSTSYDLEIYGGAISIADLILGDGDVSMYAQNDQTLTIIGGPVSRTNSGTIDLNLFADLNVFVADYITQTNGTMNILLNADRDADQSGYAILNTVNVDTNGGYFVAGGGSGDLGGTNGILGDGDGTGADDTYAYGTEYINGVAINNSTLDTNGGDIFMHGYSHTSAKSGVSFETSNVLSYGGDVTLQGVGYQNGVYLLSSTLDTTNGAVEIRGYANTNAGTGVHISGSNIDSNNGTIDIRGYGTSNVAASSSYGIYLVSSSSITGGDNDIYLYGQGGAQAIDNNYGIVFSSNGDNYISANNGDIELEGFSEGSYGISMHGDSSANGVFSMGSGDITLRATNGANINVRDANLIGGNSATGDILFEADDFSFLGNVQTTGTVTLSTYTSGMDINLGSLGTGLNINNSEMGRISASNVIIGDADNLNNDIHISNWLLNGTSYDIDLYGDNFTIDGMTLAAGDIYMQSASDIILDGAIDHSSAGGNLFFNVGNSFINNVGANAIDAGTGRYLVYVDQAINGVKNGIGVASLYNRNYDANAPATIAQTGNYYIYNYQPSVTFTADDLTLNSYDPTYSDYNYTISGLENNDTAAMAFSGSPSISTALARRDNYTIQISLGSLFSDSGYDFEFNNGLLTIQRPATTNLIDTLTSQQNGQLLSSIVETSILLGAEENASQQEARKQNQTIIEANTADIPDRTTETRAGASAELVSSDNVEIEQSVADFYGLCSLSTRYCQ